MICYISLKDEKLVEQIPEDAVGMPACFNGLIYYLMDINGCSFCIKRKLADDLGSLTVREREGQREPQLARLHCPNTNLIVVPDLQPRARAPFAELDLQLYGQFIFILVLLPLWLVIPSSLALCPQISILLPPTPFSSG